MVDARAVGTALVVTELGESGTCFLNSSAALVRVVETAPGAKDAGDNARVK